MKRRYVLIVAAAGLAGIAIILAVVRWPQPAAIPLRADLLADKVLVEKGARRLTLLIDGVELARFQIELGGQPVGHKEMEGDGRTPEGDYVIDWRNTKSRFHLSLHISYPNARDRQRAAARGLAPGGEIFIHGTPWWHWLLGGDWTAGCVAASNDDIERIWAHVPDSTPIEIRP